MMSEKFHFGPISGETIEEMAKAAAAEALSIGQTAHFRYFCELVFKELADVNPKCKRRVVFLLPDEPHSQSVADLMDRNQIGPFDFRIVRLDGMKWFIPTNPNKVLI